MINLGDMWKPVLWMVGFNTFASIILVLVVFKYPKYLLLAVNRFFCLKFGLSRKKLHLNPTFSFSYLERGKPNLDSPTLLFVHGFSSTKESFLQTIQHLPKSYHIIAFDLPGHGETTLKENEEYNIKYFVTHIKKFTDAVGISQRKFHMIGASLGGFLSGVYASEYPEDLISVSLYCPAGIAFEKGRLMKEKAERTGKFILLPQNEDELRQMFDFIAHKKLKIPSFFLSGTMQLRLEKNDFYRKLLETLVKPENFNLLEEKLNKIHTPLCLVWGKEDQCLDVECVDTIQKKLPVPPKKVIILDEVGHCILLERPKKSAYIMIEFLNSFS